MRWDEIVWAVDSERDTLASVARYLASYVEEYLAGVKVACRVQIPNSFPDQVISGEVRHHLFLAVKETLNNAIVHGAASEISFRIRVLEDRLLVSITDNGGGFDPSGLSNGHGLLNLHNRMKTCTVNANWNLPPAAERLSTCRCRCQPLITCHDHRRHC